MLTENTTKKAQPLEPDQPIQLINPSKFIGDIVGNFVKIPSNTITSFSNQLAEEAANAIILYGKNKIKDHFGFEDKWDNDQWTAHRVLMSWLFVNYNKEYHKLIPQIHWWEEDGYEKAVETLETRGFDIIRSFPDGKKVHCKIDDGTYLRISASDYGTNKDSFSLSRHITMNIYFYGKHSRKHFKKYLKETSIIANTYGRRDFKILSYTILAASTSLFDSTYALGFDSPNSTAKSSADSNSRNGIFHRMDSIALNEDIHTEILNFVKFSIISSDLYNDFAMTAAHGLLLYGPPGTGKSSIVKAIYREAVEMSRSSNHNGELSRGTRFFMFDLSNVAECVNKLYKIGNDAEDGNVLNIIVMEDIDIIVRNRDECKTPATEANYQALLQFLDGVTTPNNSLIIATTNRYESLGEDLIRKGRFDKHIEIGKMEIPECKRLMEILKVPEDKWDDLIAGKTFPMIGADVEEMCMSYHEEKLLKEHNLK